MKLFWKMSVRGLFVCGLLFAGIVFTGCYSSPVDPIFSDTPEPPGMIGTPATGYQGSEVARFHVGDTVTVTLSGLPEANRATSGTHQGGRHHHHAATSATFRPPAKPPANCRTKFTTSMCPKYYRHLTVTVNTGDRVYYVTRRSQGARPPALRRPDHRHQGHYHRRRLHGLCQPQKSLAHPRQRPAHQGQLRQGA